MKAYARPIIVVLALVTLGASLYALNVHHRLQTDPTYAPGCNISETVSCSTVFQSDYATVRGVPVAAGGAIWSGLVLLLAARGMGARDKAQASVAAGYVFVLAVVGLAAVFYWGYASFFIIGAKCPVCITMYVAIVGIFLVSSGATDISVASLPGRLIPDLRTALTQPITAVLAVMWLAGSTGLVAYFQGSEVQPAAPVASADATPAPVETLDATETAEWHTWLDRQPRVPEMLPAGQVKVRLVKFNDYQCAYCRQSWLMYRESIDRLTARYPGAFVFETHDFPLEPECGVGGTHGMSCEAAAAVRLAQAKGQGPQMEHWVFEHQGTLTRDAIKSQLKTLAGVDDYDAQYPTMVAELRKDAQLGQKIGVGATPTFFLNGIKMPTVRVGHLEEAVAYELKKAGNQPTAP